MTPVAGKIFRKFWGVFRSARKKARFKIEHARVETHVLKALAFRGLLEALADSVLVGFLADVSGIFYIFFGSGVEKREEACEQVARGGRFFLENSRTGGLFSEEAGWGYRRSEDLCREEGEGNIFCRSGVAPANQTKERAQTKSS